MAGGKSAQPIGPLSPRAHNSPLSAAEVGIVAIDSLRCEDSPRSIEEDEDHIRRLAETEAELPPILVHRDTMRVIDGRHRLKAALRRGEMTIKVGYFDGTEADAFIRAVAENIAHGLPLTLADRKAAASRIISSHPHLSDRMVASVAGLAARTVARLRECADQGAAAASARTGADRRSRPLDAAEGRLRASQVIAERPDAPLREVARSAGVSLGTAHDVRRRMYRGESPLPNGLRKADRPAGAAAPGRTRTGSGKPRPVPLAEMFRKLTEDPALRHSERGRELLSLLRARTISVNDFAHLVDAIPAHRANSIAQYARQCARSWEAFAREIESSQDYLRRRGPQG